VLTAEHGLLTLVGDRKISSILSSPFVFAEWVYKTSSRSIYPLKDGTLLDDLRHVKENFSRLAAAGQMASDLLRTQLPGKNAEEPLGLALACLRKLPLFTQPMLLNAAFRLKLLLCEGMLHEGELSSSFLQILGLSRSFQELAALPFQAEEIHTVNAMFEERFN
jgi:recombinational DNA repair protein (RecF pathway)